MKTKVISAVILAFAVASSHLYAAEKLPIEKEAETLIIAELVIQDMSLPQAIAKLEELSKKADPKKKGISYNLDPALAGTEFDSITLNLKNVPVSEAARFIATLSGLKLKAEDKTIIFTKL